MRAHITATPWTSLRRGGVPCSVNITIRTTGLPLTRPTLLREVVTPTAAELFLAALIKGYSNLLLRWTIFPHSARLDYRIEADETLLWPPRCGHTLLPRPDWGSSSPGVAIHADNPPDPETACCAQTPAVSPTHMPLVATGLHPRPGYVPLAVFFTLQDRSILRLAGRPSTLTCCGLL